MGSISRIVSLIKVFWPQAIGNVFFNLLSTVFSLVSLTMVVPFLRILFRDESIEAIPWPGLSLNNVNAVFEYGLGWLMTQYETKTGALFAICLFIVVVFFLKNLTRYLAMYFLADIRNGSVRNLRNKVYNKILHLPLSYYNEKRKGDIITRATTDVAEVEWGVLGFLEVCFKEPFTFVVFFAAMFVVSPWLTLMVIVILPIAGFLISLVSRSLRKQSHRAQDTLGYLMSIMEETISGLKVVWAFGAKDSQEAKFKENNQQYYKMMNGILRRKDMSSPLSEFLSISVVVLVLYLGGKLVLNEQGLEPETFIAFLVMFSQIISPAKSFSTANFNIQKGLASLDRIDLLLGETNGHPPPLNQVALESFADKIVFDNVSFAYENRKVLRNISFEINKGEVVALVGQSGSGKSTIIELLLRNYEIREGQITIDGVDIKDIPIENLRRLFGLVTQDPILFNDSIRSNIQFGKPNASEDMLFEAATMANASEFIGKLESGLDTHIGDRGVKLSGGEKQRITIARAVLKNPPVMLLDEATSSLDSESEKAVQLALDKLMDNKTSLVIAHRLSTIKNADKIIVMKDGEVIERGSHETLMQNKDNYQKLVDWQTFS